MQIFKYVSLYNKCNGLPLLMRNELSGDFLLRLFPEAIFPCGKSWKKIKKKRKERKKNKKFPDGVLTVCLAVSFLWEKATFADSNHKYNPIKSYYVNVNRNRDKTKQWNVSFRPKWVDFWGHKESPLSWLLQGTCKPSYWLKYGKDR